MSSSAGPTPARSIAANTLMVMIAFGAAKAISLAQTFIIANVFGVGRQWDAYVTANRIPELIFTLIAGGALAHAFIPVFGGFLARDDRAGAWRTASYVLNTIFAATFMASTIAFVAAPWLVAQVVAPGFDAANQAQTVELMRILLISTLIFSVSGIVMGVLHSHQHFLLPALAPIMFDVGILLGVIFLLPAFGVAGIALGAVLGSAMHLGVQVPGLLRVRAQWHLAFGFNDPVLRQIMRLMLPRIAGLGVFSLNFIVMNNIASRLGEGSVSALDWGWRLMQIPQTLIGTAMGTVIFPTLAALSAVGNEDGKRATMAGSLRFILVTTIPASFGLIVLGGPVISLLERGAFDASASSLVFSTLQFFALGLITHSLLEVIARSFYADKDTLTPLWAALGGAAINLGGAFLFSEAIGVGGLALANSLGVTFEVAVLLWVLRRRWHGIHESALGRTLAASLVASLVMALAVSATGAALAAFGLSGGVVLTLIAIGVQVIVGAIVYAGVAVLLRMAEVSETLTLIRRRRTLEQA